MLLGILAILVGSGGIGGAVGVIVVKRMNRRVDEAAAVAAEATAEATRAGGRKDDLETLRGIIAEVRASESKKAAQIESLESRVEKLEERERHMLTRAAVHEAWDQLAFQALIVQNPSHPPPPPLITREVLPPDRDD